MELKNLLQAIASLLAFVIGYKALRRRVFFNTKTQGKRAPEPQGAWPLIGHLHLLGGQIPVCRTLAAMADKHGLVFNIRKLLKKYTPQMTRFSSVVQLMLLQYTLVMIIPFSGPVQWTILAPYSQTSHPEASYEQENRASQECKSFRS